MVQLGHCARCRTYSSEVWSRKDVCPVCGSPMEHVVEGMGNIEWVPRAFNILGIGSIVVAIALIFYYLMSASSDKVLLTACIVLFGGGGLLFTASLLSQMYITDQAIARKGEGGPRRISRELRGGRGGDLRGAPMGRFERRSGPGRTPPRGGGRTGKKIPLR